MTTLNEPLIARCRGLLLRLRGDDRDSLQERLDRYLVAVSNARDSIAWEVTARDRQLGLLRTVEEEEGKRKGRRGSAQ